MKVNKIKSKMTELGYTQQKLANVMGISVQTLNAKLKGRSSFSLDEVVSMIKILELEDPEAIFFDCLSQKCNDNELN